jgi:hypothetical protein
MSFELKEKCKLKMSSTLHPLWDDFENFIDTLCLKHIHPVKKYRKGSQGPEMVLHLSNRKDTTLLRLIPQRSAIKARLINLDNVINNNNKIIEPDKIDITEKFLRFEYLIIDRRRLIEVQNSIAIALNSIKY